MHARANTISNALRRTITLNKAYGTFLPGDEIRNLAKKVSMVCTLWGYEIGLTVSPEGNKVLIRIGRVGRYACVESF